MEALWHGGSDIGILVVVGIIGWLLKDFIKRVRDDVAILDGKISDHVKNCAHITPRERDLADQNLSLRFTMIDKSIAALHDEIERPREQPPHR